MEHGNVTSVKYRDGGVYCDVMPIRKGQEYEDVAVMKPQAGFIQVPRQKETVAIQQLDDGTRFISHVISRETDYPASMREGEVTLQLDEGTRIAFEENGDDYDLHLEASGDVYINGTKQ